MIELTAEQLQALDNANGVPPTLVDPRTQTPYVLIRAEDFQRRTQDAPAGTAAVAASPPADEIPGMSEGIKRAKAALRRDLPELLASRRNRGKYVCYHLEERIGIHKDYFKLIRECNRRNLPDDEWIVETIEPGAGSIEETEIETMSNV